MCSRFSEAEFAKTWVRLSNFCLIDIFEQDLQDNAKLGRLQEQEIADMLGQGYGTVQTPAVHTALCKGCRICNCR